MPFVLIFVFPGRLAIWHVFAFIMDRIFQAIRAFRQVVYSMLIGTGYSVPGIMAARTIENERDRKLTIMLTPFIPCNAKLPGVCSVCSSFFPEQVLGRILRCISGV